MDVRTGGEWEEDGASAQDKVRKASFVSYLEDEEGQNDVTLKRSLTSAEDNKPRRSLSVCVLSSEEIMGDEADEMSEEGSKSRLAKFKKSLLKSTAAVSSGIPQYLGGNLKMRD